VPDQALPYPWESCITSGGGWSFTPDAKYMSARQAVQLLVDIVSKGGNLLLNIAPGPDGAWQQGAYDLLKEIGAWIQVNGEAIYGSRPLAPFKEGNVCMTRQNNGNTFFLYLAGPNETVMPKEIRVNSHRPSVGAQVTLLGSNIKLSWKTDVNGFIVTIPDELRTKAPCRYAWTIKVSSLM
jgi:alpha-L-fucosidase